MNLLKFEAKDTKEVIKLFNDVFSQSEGADEGALIGGFVSELIETTDSEDLIGFVAKDQNKIIGCIFFSRLFFETEVNAFILSPVAVNTDNQKQGVGQKLINFGIEYLKDKNVELLFTYGDPNYYGRFGFTHVSESLVKAPLKLTYPDGWIGQSLKSGSIDVELGEVRCVSALNKQVYW